MKALRIKISNQVTKKAILPLAITAATLGIGLNNQAYGQYRYSVPGKEKMNVIQRKLNREAKEYVVQTMFNNFDGDKFPDEVEITRTENSNHINIYFFKGDGKGHFTHKDEKNYFLLPDKKIDLRTNESYQIFPVDYNGDGAVDLIIRRINSENSTQDYVFENKGDGTFANYYEKHWDKTSLPTKKIYWNNRKTMNYKELKD